LVQALPPSRRRQRRVSPLAPHREIVVVEIGEVALTHLDGGERVLPPVPDFVEREWIAPLEITEHHIVLEPAFERPAVHRLPHTLIAGEVEFLVERGVEQPRRTPEPRSSPGTGRSDSADRAAAAGRSRETAPDCRSRSSAGISGPRPTATRPA